MAQSNFVVEIGYGEKDSITVQGTVETTTPGESGLYVKLFAPVDTQAGNPLLAGIAPSAVGVRVERRYELPSGAPLRIEVDATAGSAGAPISVTATTTDGRSATGSGMTNETIALELS